jgi:Vitamin K-dependent gamma-carboxylase
MTRYPTSYRSLVLTKAGLGLAYLWFCWDFLRINQAAWKNLHALIPGPAEEAICSNPFLNHIFVQALLFISQPIFIWSYFLLSPVAVGLYVWGRHRWLQIVVGLWIWSSMAAMSAQASIFMSTADFWLAWCFILHVVAGLVTPRGEWNTSQPAFEKDLWRKNPVIHSEYALLIVILQFTVYFYAGLNKLIYGWGEWTSGVAIQNLSYDPSMRDLVRGVPIPYFISLVLCYVTLAQRLIVPFGFFIMRYRGWAVLILGAMHVGYDLIMQVAIFPLIGVSCLLLIVPPRSLALPLFSLRSNRSTRRKTSLKSVAPSRASLPQKALMAAIVGLLLVEPAIMSGYSLNPPYWNVKLATQLHWIMFADGGVQSKDRFKIAVKVHDPATGLVGYNEITDLPLQYLPETWRTRLYVKFILLQATRAHEASSAQVEATGYLENYIKTAVFLYGTEIPRQPPAEQLLLAIDPYDKKSFPP